MSLSLAHVKVPAALANVDAVARARYGACILDLPSNAALWLAEHILATEGREVYGAIDRFRNRFGIGSPVPTYGSPLWTAWSARVRA